MAQEHQDENSQVNEVAPVSPPIAPEPKPEPPEPTNEVSDTLGKYLNTMVADLGIQGKGQYLRDLFSKYEAELRAEGAVKPDRDFMSAEEYSKTEDWFRRSANGKIEGSDCFDFAEAYLQAYLNRADV